MQDWTEMSPGRAENLKYTRERMSHPGVLL